jgi:hypothetical protein
MLYREQIAMAESIVLHYKTSYIICFTLKIKWPSKLRDNDKNMQF